MIKERNPNRVTIMVVEGLDKKLRDYQSKIIRQTQSSFSYSRALNTKLSIGLRSRKKVDQYEYLDGEKRRVTVMFDRDVLKKIKLEFGRHIIDCANDYCEMPSWSFSKEVDKHLRRAF